MRAVWALAAVVLVCAAPAAPGRAQGRGVQTGEIVDLDFAPREFTVGLNTKLTWTNKASRPHTVTDRGGTFDTDPISPGRSASITFTVPGRYSFFCRINPGRMNGIIVVNPEGRPKVTRVQATDPARQGETLRFDPAALEVQTGSTIVFANVGGSPHTLTADDRSFDTGAVTPGAEGGRFAGGNATITVGTPGTFPFHCEVHPQAMKGVLTVKGDPRRAASGAPARTEVDMVDFAYRPPERSVAPGGEVIWRNRGPTGHTATFDDVQIDTGLQQPGAEAKLAAPQKPGSYSYRCNVHPKRMRGVLVVVGQNIADPTKLDVDRPAAAVGGGPGAGVSALALATGVIGAFLGGFGISAFVRAGR